MTEDLELRRETTLIAWVALAAGLASLAYCVRRGILLLYGDAVAHLHIARRVFDSITPGYRQLGSVWLPLPHILLLPFIWNMNWWHTGLAGALVSIPSYVLGCAGIYRLARFWLPIPSAIVVVAFYGLNPGLLYLATTAMTEPLFLAEMIWTVVLLVAFQKSPQSNLLVRAGVVLVGAIFTRYDGWVYAAVAWLFATWPFVTWVKPRIRWGRKSGIAGAYIFFTAMLIAAPTLWMAYNAKQFGDPLDFLRGPYSARAIEARTTPPGSAPHPGMHDMKMAATYFLKAAEMGAAPLLLGKLLCWLSAAGLLYALWKFRDRQIWPVLLLVLPLPFYAYSVAYGSVPIFIPVWRPWSWYNTRYGMELLPAFALFLGVLTDTPKWRGYVAAGASVLVLANSVALLIARPLVFQEAVENGRSRIAFETALAKGLLQMPGSGRILMHVSSYVGAVQQAAIPLHRIVNEGDYLSWQRALQDPEHSVSMVVAFDGDEVSKAVAQHPQGLILSNVICTTGQPCARIYRVVP